MKDPETTIQFVGSVSPPAEAASDEATEEVATDDSTPSLTTTGDSLDS